MLWCRACRGETGGDWPGEGVLRCWNRASGEAAGLPVKGELPELRP